MTYDLPAGPPPEVLAEVDVAWERAQAGPEVHLVTDPLAHRAWGVVHGIELTASQVVALVV